MSKSQHQGFSNFDITKTRKQEKLSVGFYGWVGIPPFFVRAALPTLLSLRSPTQTLGYLHGYSGSKSPENITQLKQSNVCYLCGDAKTRVAYQGQNIRPADFAPTLLRTRPRKKGREPRIIFVVHVIISFVGLKPPTVGILNK